MIEIVRPRYLNQDKEKAVLLVVNVNFNVRQANVIIFSYIYFICINANKNLYAKSRPIAAMEAQTQIDPIQL